MNWKYQFRLGIVCVIIFAELCFIRNAAAWKHSRPAASSNSAATNKKREQHWDVNSRRKNDPQPPPGAASKYTRSVANYENRGIDSNAPSRQKFADHQFDAAAAAAERYGAFDEYEDLENFIGSASAGEHSRNLGKKGKKKEDELSAIDISQIASDMLPILISVEPMKEFCVIHRASNDRNFDENGVRRRQSKDQVDSAALIKYEVIDINEGNDVEFSVTLDQSFNKLYISTESRGKYLLNDSYDYNSASFCFANQNPSKPINIFYEFANSYSNENEDGIDEIFTKISSAVSLIKSSTFHMAVLESAKMNKAQNLIQKITYVSILRVIITVGIGIFLYRTFSKMLEIKTYI